MAVDGSGPKGPSGPNGPGGAEQAEASGAGVAGGGVTEGRAEATGAPDPLPSLVRWTLGSREFKQLVRGEVVSLRDGDRRVVAQIALEDIGYVEMMSGVQGLLGGQGPPPSA